MNCTNILAPLLWYQVVIIHAHVAGDTWVPCGFALLPDKKESSYFKLFNGIVDILKAKDLTIAATYVMCDFEIALRKVCYFNL